MSEQEQTPRERVQEWLSGDHEGIAMYGATREVREAIRAVLADLAAWPGKWNATLDREARWIQKLTEAEAERDALRAEVEQLKCSVTDAVDEADKHKARAERAEAALREIEKLHAPNDFNPYPRTHPGLIQQRCAHGCGHSPCQTVLLVRVALRDPASREEKP